MKKKKKKLVQYRFWATAQLYCEIVLLALQLYCKREGWKNCSEKKKNLYCNTIFVLQRRELGGLKLYCKRFMCVAIQWSAGVQNCIAIQFIG